jgi:DNA-binding NarL/FixJ family response regulator
MLSAIFDSKVVGDEFLDAVFARSGGNPFFVEELCRVLLERGDVFLEGGDWSRRELADIELPSTVRAALLARTHHVPASSLAALRVAALAGEVIDPAVLAYATGLDTAAVARVVSDGIDYQLVLERREESGPAVAFRHNLTRELLARELVGPERQETHRRLAAALEEIHADDIDALSGALADHHFQGGNTAAAATYAVRAARAACIVRAPHEMVARYEQAIRLTARRDPQRLDLMLEAAEAIVGVSDRRVARSVATEARDLALAADDRVAAARAFRVLSQIRWWEGDAAGSVELGRQARALLEGRGDRWEVWALSYLARRCALLDREDEARELVARALPMAEAIGQLSAVSWLHDTLAVLGGDEATVASEWSAALDAARAAGDEPQQLTVLTNSGYVALWHGDLTLAASRFAAAMELATRLVTPFEAHAGVGLGWVQALRGELSEALSTVARHQRTTDLPNTLDALTALVEAHLRRGDRTTAAALADEQWRLAQSTGENQTMVPALASLARVRLADGLEHARTAFAEALTHASAGASGRQLHWTFTPDFAQALHAGADPSGLASWVDAVRTMTIGAADHRHNRAALHLCEGLLAALKEAHDDARAHLAAAAEVYSEVPCPARQAESLLALAAAEGGRNPEAARAAAGEAQALAAAHGMPDLLAAADAALRRAGVRVPGRRRPPADAAAAFGLSEREREVAVLVAQGLSNAEVGRRLFLSERTARNHVSNILAKLELRSRAEVARWAVQHGLLDEARPGSLTG